MQDERKTKQQLIQELVDMRRRLTQQDSTERQQAEEALRESERRYRALASEAEEGRQLLAQLYRVAIAMQTSWERQDRIQAFSRAVQEVVGCDRFYILLATADGSHFEMIATHDAEAPARLPLSRVVGPFYQAF